MPATQFAESLVGIQEVKDGAASLDDSADPNSAFTAAPALKARRQLIPRFPVLGAADMLYVRKRYTPVVGVVKHYGYYHFVRGVAPSSVAKISAYIVDVIRNNGLDPLSWVSAGAWEVASATFVSYNLMAAADLVVHVNFPGGTTADAYDRNGNPILLNEVFWNQLHVSSVIRDFSSHGENPLYPCLRCLSSSSALHDEEEFLDAARKSVQSWHLSGTDCTEISSTLAAKSRVAVAIRKHFLDTCRYDSAIDLFTDSRIVRHDPLCAVHAAAAARVKGDIDRAISILDNVEKTDAQSDIALLERANCLYAGGHVEEALEAAKKASSFTSGDLNVWFKLASLFADAKDHAEAFKALNNADMPPPVLDGFLRELFPNRNKLTAPLEGAAGGTDAVRVLAKRLKEEKNYTNDRTDAILSELPGKLMGEADYSCYDVMVKILNDVHWDRMLSIRGQCFVMESDIDSNKDEGNDEDGKEEDSSEPKTDGEEKDEEDSTEGKGSTADNIAVNIQTNGADGSGETEKNGLTNDERKKSLEKTGKKVCKPWLDYLVNNMYYDLRGMALWNAEEQQFAVAASLAATELANKSHSESGHSSSRDDEKIAEMEAQDTEQPLRRTADEVMKTTERPAADWLRRGELALRLGKLEEAKTAYWVCVKLSEKEKKPAATALCRLMTLSAKDKDTRTTIRCADMLWTFLDENTDRTASSESTRAVSQVRNAVFSVIAANGLRAVREDLVGMADVDRKRLEGLLLDAVALRVEGFST